MASSRNFSFGLPWLCQSGQAGAGTGSGVSLSEQQNINKRFVELSEEQVNELKKKTVRKNTTSVTNTSVNTFKKFCKQVNCSKTLEELTKEELNSLLKRFYAGARKENGEVYKMTAFNALRYGLQRHFLELKSWDIKADSSFIECNQIFRTMQVRLKQCGKGKVESYPEIEPDDIRKLYSSFDVETPRGLQEKVWFDIMFRLCRRGRENLRQMTKSSFAVAIDATGAKFVFQVEDECDKNHNENDTSSDTPGEGSMYAVDGHSLCPVKTFELYKSKLSPNCPFLRTKPKEMRQTLMTAGTQNLRWERKR